MSEDMNRNTQQRQFWILHLSGWLAWGIFAKYLLTRAILEDTPPGYFLYVMLITLIAMTITLGLRLLYRILWERPVWVRALAFLGGSAAAGYLWLLSRSFIYSRWFANTKEMGAWMENAGEVAKLYEKVSYMETYSSSLWVMLAWSVFYFAIKYHRVFQEYRESALRSATMAHEAQLKMLRYQLNPHFLFNTLNAISTLILE